MSSESGGRAASAQLSLFAQRKVSKRKGTLLTRPAAFLRFSPDAARKELVADAPQTPFRFIRVLL